MPATPSLSSHTLAQDGQAPEALTSDSKTSVSFECFRSAFLNWWFATFDWVTFLLGIYFDGHTIQFKKKIIIHFLDMIES